MSLDVEARNRFQTLWELERELNGVIGLRSQSRGAFFDMAIGVNLKRSVDDDSPLLLLDFVKRIRIVSQSGRTKVFKRYKQYIASQSRAGIARQRDRALECIYAKPKYNTIYGIPFWRR